MIGVALRLVAYIDLPSDLHRYEIELSGAVEDFRVSASQHYLRGLARVTIVDEDSPVGRTVTALTVKPVLQEGRPHRYILRGWTALGLVKRDELLTRLAQLGKHDIAPRVWWAPPAQYESHGYLVLGLLRADRVKGFSL